MPPEKSKSPENSAASGAGTLYIVATPIGNLGDITLRALETLKNVSAIACEDTRTSGKLLHHFQIDTKMVSYHEHNAAKQRPKLFAQLQRGESIALITDAGTPLISDPGYKLVDEARALNIPVVPIPGACAAITALCAAGLPSDQFTFCGFLPSKATARRNALDELSTIPGTLIFYESAQRVVDMLAAIHDALGAREVVIARELTKRHEEFLRGCIGDVLADLQARERIKGEIVVLVAPGEAKALDDDAVDALLRAALKTHSTKHAAAQVAEQTGLSKSELYQRILMRKTPEKQNQQGDDT